MSTKKSTAGSKCNGFIRDMDMFGAPINFTYKKDNTYKSTLGGLATLLTRMLVSAYFAYQNICYCGENYNP